MKKPPWNLVMLRDFSGGLVSNKAIHMLAANEWAELTNIRVEKGGTQIEKRGGSTKKNSEILVRYE